MASASNPTLTPELNLENWAEVRSYIIGILGYTPLDLNHRIERSAGILPGKTDATVARPYGLIADYLEIRDNDDWLIQAEGATFRSPERVIQGWRSAQLAEDKRLSLTLPDGYGVGSSGSASGTAVKTTSRRTPRIW